LFADLRARVEVALRRHAMLAGGERVLVAVSGGADSVALLYLLRELAAPWRLALHAVHVDHGLRPDSGADAAFVEALGRRLGVPVEVVAVTVDRRGSLEAAARTARYAALRATAARLDAARIAVAHTADDQAETVLMRLLAGAGVRGLAGIPPVRGRIIRPLLDLRREELCGALAAAGLDWRDDPSNRDLRFLRNRIRHEALPLLGARADVDVVAALGRVARLARETTAALDRVAGDALDRLAVAAPGSLVLPLTDLRALPRPVAAEVLREAAARLGSRAPLRAWGHRGLARILAVPPPRRPFRLGGVAVEVSIGRVRLAREAPVALPPRPLTVPGTVVLPEIGRLLEARLVSASGYPVPRDASRVAFDADRLSGPLVVRARRAGDRLVPFGGGERRLKAVLIDARVPRWERARIPVVAAAGEIVWLAGLRRGAAAPVTDRTRTVLELALRSLPA
jgi:tRNA(Ile)-lysidine synthase